MTESETVKKLLKRYGAGVITTARDVSGGEMKPEAFSTGSLRLDTALGGGNKLGGIYRQRITSVWGEKSTGKTTLCNCTIADAQRQGEKCLYVSFEGKYDKGYAMDCGVDLGALMFLQPIPDDKKIDILPGESVFIILEELIKHEGLGLIAIDSLSAMSPKREFDGEVGEFNPGLQAQIAGPFMRKIGLLVVRHNIAMILIEQARDNWGGTSFSAKKKMAGANAVFHHSSTIVKAARGYVSNSDKVKDGKEIIGQYSRFYIEHNQVNKPYQSADVVIDENGINSYHDLLSYADEVAFISKKGGGYYSYVDENGEVVNMAHGLTNAATFLAENRDVFEYLRGKVIDSLQEDPLL